MNFINNLIPGNLIDAFGWTLLHSIWQGAAIALGLALLMFGLRRYSSRTRYFVGVMALMLVLGISLTTFFNFYETGGGNLILNPENSTAAVLSASAQSSAQTGVLTETGITSFFRTYFANHLPLIVTLWFLGILILALRLAGGMLYNQRVKLHRSKPLTKSWQNRAENLCRRIGIQKPVRMLESALIKVPITIGHLKPVILLPVGMVAGLPGDQVEALISHELAHILRKDYLVNLLQRIVDILFFYHPGIRWISSHVRLERENCCDDIAVATCGDSLNFARALTNIGGSGIGDASPALAAAGKSKALLSRVKRLFNPRRKGSEFAEGFVGACILVLFSLTLVVSAHAAAGLSGTPGDPMETDEAMFSQTVYEAEAGAVAAGAVAPTDAEKEKKKPAKEEKSDKEKKDDDEEALKQKRAEMARIAAELKAKAREMSKIDREKIEKLVQEIREKTKDIKPIDPEKMKKLQEEIAKRVKAMQFIDQEKLAKFRAEMAKFKVEFVKIDKEKLAEMSAEIAKKVKEMKPFFDKEKMAAIKAEMKKKTKDWEKLSPEERARLEKELQEKFEKSGALDTEKLAKMEQEISKLTDEFAFIDQEKLAKFEKEIAELSEEMGVIDKEKMAELGIEMEKQAAELAAYAEELAKHEKDFEKHDVELKKQEVELKKQEVEFKKQEVELRKQEVFLNSLKEMLLKDGLITDATDFELKLTTKGLWVNGKKQSKKVFKKYKKMYETETGKKLQKGKTFQIINKK